jgi:hypothetical protein
MYVGIGGRGVVISMGGNSVEIHTLVGLTVGWVLLATLMVLQSAKRFFSKGRASGPCRDIVKDVF